MCGPRLGHAHLFVSFRHVEHVEHVDLGTRGLLVRGRHRAPRTSEDTRLRHRQRVRRGVSILAVTLLATIPVGVSAAMVPQRTVASVSDAPAATPSPRSLADREGDFKVADSLRGAADKIGDTTVSV